MEEVRGLPVFDGPLVKNRYDRKDGYGKSVDWMWIGRMWIRKVDWRYQAIKHVKVRLGGSYVSYLVPVSYVINTIQT